MALFNQSQALSGLQNKVNTLVSGFESTWTQEENKIKSEREANINYKNQAIAKAKAIVANAKQQINSFISTLSYTKAQAQSNANAVFAELDKLLNEFINSISAIPVPTPKPSPVIYHPPTNVVSDLDSYLKNIGI